MRLFVSIDPDAAVVRAMRDLLAALRVCGEAWSGHETPEMQVHLTLQFIGETSERELEDVYESVRRACGGVRAFDLAPRRFVSFPLDERSAEPDRQVRARLVAIETDRPPELMELHRRLAARFARPKRGKAGVEKEDFVPHLTLWRFAASGHAPLINEPVNLPAFRVREVRLMRSILRHTGAEHRAIECVALA